MPDYTVTTAFKGQDGTSAALSKMRGNVKSFSKTSKAEFKSIGTVFKGTFAANMMSRGVTSMIGVARRGIGTVLEEYIDFDSQIGQAAAKFPDRIKRGTEEFEILGAAARKIGAETEHTSAQAARGLAEYAKAGIDAATAMGLLKGTAELATNAEVEFATAASLSLDALDAFNLRSKDGAETAANLATVNDVLTGVVTSAKLDFEDFGETLKHTGPVAAAVGASFADMASATGLVAKAGIRGSKAGTDLKNMYLGLAASTPEARRLLQKLGVEAIDPVTGDMRDMLDVMVDLSAATEEMGNAERLAATKTIFGKRAVASATKVMSLGADEIAEYRDNLNDTKDASKDMAVEIRKSLENKLKTLQSTLIETGFKIIEAFTGEGADGLDGMIESIRKYDVKPIVDGMKDLVSVGKTMFRMVRDNWDYVKLLAKAFVAVKIAIAAVKFTQWGAGLFGAMKGMAGHVKNTGLLAGNLGKINKVTGAAGAGLYTPAAKGAAVPAKGGAAAVGMGPAQAGIIGTMIGIAAAAAIRDAGETQRKEQWEREKSVMSIGERVGAGGLTINQAKAQIGMLAQIKAEAQEEATGLFFGFKKVGAWLTNAEDPMNAYIKRNEEINEVYIRLMKQMGLTAEDIRKLGEAAVAGQSIANVNVSVSGPGAGEVTTTTSTSGPAAPKVDVKKSGEAA